MNNPFAEALMRAARGHDDEEERSYPMIEAQLEMLAHLVLIDGLPKSFTRGDRVHYPTGLSPFLPKSKERLAMIFWRDLDDESYYDHGLISTMQSAERMNFPHVDCLTAVYPGDGPVQFHLGCKALLRSGEYRA